MNYIHGHPHSKEAEFYELLLDYDESLEKDLADCRAIWYESGTQNLMVGDYRMSDRIASMVISKYYGFIKGLVDNHKIDTNNLSLKAFKNIFSGGGFVEVSDLEVLLMLLSISDSPIDDLISYLK